MNRAPPWYGVSLIADTSAWTAIHRASLLGNVPTEWDDAMRTGQLLTSPVVKLELLHSTRTEEEFETWDERLSRLRSVPVTATACDAAIGALRELASNSAGYHRVDLGDALIAASAMEAPGVGVLHYNPRDFDKLREVLDFENVLLAPTGTFERDP